MKYVFAGITVMLIILMGLSMYLPEFSKESVVACFFLTIVFGVFTSIASSEDW